MKQRRVGVTDTDREGDDVTPEEAAGPEAPRVPCAREPQPAHDAEAARPGSGGPYRAREERGRGPGRGSRVQDGGIRNLRYARWLRLKRAGDPGRSSDPPDAPGAARAKLRARFARALEQAGADQSWRRGMGGSGPGRVYWRDFPDAGRPCGTAIVFLIENSDGTWNVESRERLLRARVPDLAAARQIAEEIGSSF